MNICKTKIHVRQKKINSTKIYLCIILYLTKINYSFQCHTNLGDDSCNNEKYNFFFGFLTHNYLDQNYILDFF